LITSLTWRDLHLSVGGAQDGAAGISNWLAKPNSLRIGELRLERAGQPIRSERL